MLFKNIETDKPFTFDVFQVISVHSTKITYELFFFITGYINFNIEYRYGLPL